jgi:hypothetical protein
MQYGQLNSVDYTSLQEVVGDLQAIWTESIQSELEIEEAEFKVSVAENEFLGCPILAYGKAI